MRRIPGSIYYTGLKKNENGEFEEPLIYIASGPVPQSKEPAWYDNHEYENRLIYRCADGKSLP